MPPVVRGVTWAGGRDGSSVLCGSESWKVGERTRARKEESGIQRPPMEGEREGGRERLRTWERERERERETENIGERETENMGKREDIWRRESRSRWRQEGERGESQCSVHHLLSPTPPQPLFFVSPLYNLSHSLPSFKVSFLFLLEWLIPSFISDALKSSLI